MLRTLENITTNYHGKYGTIPWIAILLITVIYLPVQWAWSQDYYINTYENPSGPNPEQLGADIYIKAIDLYSGTVIDSLQLNTRGDILFKKPVEVLLNNNHFLITIDEYDTTVFYTILRPLDGGLTVIRNDSIENANVEIFRQYQGESGFRFGLTTNRGRHVTFRTGLYGIDHAHNFRYIREANISEEPGLLRNIAPYDYLIKVPNDTLYNLYYTIGDYQYLIVKLNSNHTQAIDTLPLQPGIGNSVFAFHAGRNKLYCLHYNFELHYNEDIDSAWKSRDDNYVNPVAWVINPVTLRIEEQIPIADYPEGNYPGEDGGIADVVGDYVVYYFFRGTGKDRFDPAMLLIFDTRTNEATWLRVGWR
jgi:hypothetical protein